MSITEKSHCFHTFSCFLLVSHVFFMWLCSTREKHIRNGLILLVFICLPSFLLPSTIIRQNWLRDGLRCMPNPNSVLTIQWQRIRNMWILCWDTGSGLLKPTSKAEWCFFSEVSVPSGYRLVQVFAKIVQIPKLHQAIGRKVFI